MKKLILFSLCLFLYIGSVFAKIDKDTPDTLHVSSKHSILKSEKKITRVYEQLQSNLEAFHQLLNNKASDAEFKQWYLNTRESLHDLDIHQLKLQTYTIVHMHKKLTELHEHIDTLLTKKKDMERAEDIYNNKLIPKYQRWLSQKDNIGGHPKTQYERVVGLREYFTSAYYYLKIFNKDLKINDGVKLNKAEGLKSLIATLKVPLHTIKRKKDKGYYFKTPQTRAFDHMFDALRISQGYNISLDGENIVKDIPQDPNSKEVYLFLPTHNVTLRDTMLIASLHFPHYILFCNISLFPFYSSNSAFPLYERYKMSSFPEIIAMGGEKGGRNRRIEQGLSASDKAIQSLKQQASNILINFPSGVQTIFGEVPPLAHNFSEHLIQKIFNNELRPNIILANFDSDPSFMKDINHPHFAERNLHAKIHPMITSHQLKKILKVEEHLTSDEISNYLSHLFYGNHAQAILQETLKDEKLVQEEIESLKRPDILGVYLRSLYIVGAQYKMLTLKEIEERISPFNLKF